MEEHSRDRSESTHTMVAHLRNRRGKAPASNEPWGAEAVMETGMEAAVTGGGDRFSITGIVAVSTIGEEHCEPGRDEEMRRGMVAERCTCVHAG